jgi:cytochrome c-type biogenesis protein CcmF
MNIEYVGEWTVVAEIGRGLIALGLASSLLAVVAYLAGWERFARRAFTVHAVSIFGAIALVFALFIGHRYEFQYIWKHLNNEMPMRFIFSAFWGGQEGGFLMWMFWHNVLGLVLMRGKHAFTATAMAVLAAIEFFLTTMLLGVYFGDFQLGLDPFLFMRNAPENIGLPWTLRPDYLSLPFFADGQGLNPLLQNYWMTIHPPTLFLGFASTAIPFALAIAGLRNRADRSWMKPALRWSFFGVGILGLGILMGGAWAYEALSFGGFWAWDPVENSSLVPWITLTAGAHLLLVNQNRKRPTALFSTFYFPLISFLLVVYSTFLTKSGILGDTSVHSFVDSGILPQLLAYLLAFTVLAHVMLLQSPRRRWRAVALLAPWLVVMLKGWVVEALVGLLVTLAGMAITAYRKDIESHAEEDALWSRDFWMFVGSLLLLVSAVHITWQTSIPVFNALLEPFSMPLQWLADATGSGVIEAWARHDMAPGTDLDRTYHLVQVPLAVLILMLIGMTQWLKYKQTKLETIRKELYVAYGVAFLGLIGVLVFYGFEAWEAPRVALLAAAVFAASANFRYLRKVAGSNWKQWGSPLAHVGFALVLFGAVLSTSQKEIISQNRIGDLATLNEELNNREDLLLMQGDTLPMGPYFVSYVAPRTEGIHVKFRMDYFESVPKPYLPGDVVLVDGMVFQATDEHFASSRFEEDMEAHWQFVPFPNQRQARQAMRWEAGVPGDFLFTLNPRIQLNERMGNAPEPDTRHWWNRDLYTHIKWGRVSPPETDEEGWLGGRESKLAVGDSVLMGSVLVRLDSLRAVRDEERPELGLLERDLALAACITLKDKGKEVPHEPLYIVRDSLIIPDLYVAEDWGLRFRIDRFDPLTETIDWTVWEHESVRRDFVVMQAAIFPMINILWIGVILMTIGSLMAVWSRLAQRKGRG